MKLYVISGASGMTGNELVRQILNLRDGSKILGFDNFFASSVETISDCLSEKNFDFNELDLNNSNDMKKIADKVLALRDDYEEIIYINCAAVVHTEYFYRVNETFETNVIGMKNFLEQAIRVGAKKFINCSTSEVYSMNSWNEKGGVVESDFITLADAEHSQRTSYAVGKLMTEFFMKDAVLNKKISGCSIRFANVYSKNEKYPKHIIPHIINSLKQNGKVVLLENSRRNKRTFLNNYDSCSAVLALLNSPDSLDGSIYNVATDEEVSILELVKMCADKMKIAQPIIEFQGYRASDPERRILSTEKIRARTNWKPVITLDAGLTECIANYLEQN